MTGVSIPIWCDWKKFDDYENSKRMDVSIPIWCDWKDVPKNFPYEFLKFQFLYGAIGRDVLRSFGYTFLVSIPIWCDWKSSHWSLSPGQSSFNSYMVRLEVGLR